MSEKMKVDLHGKTAIITGAGGVIGRAIAVEMARNGANVVLVGRSVKPLEATRDEIADFGGECSIIPTDISDKSQIDRLISATIEKYGDLDILVNNAGINGGANDRKCFWEFDDDLWERVIATDLSAVYYLSKPAAKHMVEKGKGSIINIASVNGVVPLRLQIAYNAAKGAVVNMTKAMALELADQGVRCNAICPGSVLNEQLKEVFYNDKERSHGMLSHIPMHRTGEAVEQAAMACFLASDDASYITGAINIVDGGWTCGYSRDF